MIVLDHSQCGAVKATISQIQNPSEGGSPNVGEIVKHIRPALEPLVQQSEQANSANSSQLVHQGVRANVVATAQTLRQDSAILKQLIAEDGLVVIGAEYSLETGEVDFFDKA